MKNNRDNLVMPTADDLFDGSNAHLLTEAQKDFSELEDIAGYFRRQGKPENADFIMKVAAKLLAAAFDMAGSLIKFQDGLPQGREWASVSPRPVSGEYDKWTIGDEPPITGHTLRQQRGYHRHVCGRWSRYSGGGSDNSLEA